MLLKIKKYIPHSLFGRFILIFAIPVLMVQIVAVYVFFYFYVDVISKNISRTIVSEMRFVSDYIEKELPRKEVDEFVSYVGIKYYVNKTSTANMKKIGDSNWKANRVYQYVNLFPIIDPLNRFKSELRRQNLAPFRIYKIKDNSDILVVRVKRGDKLISFEILIKRIHSSSKYVFILWMILTAILTSTVAIIFLRNQLRPLDNLSSAAKKFGQGRGFSDIKPSGSRELRSLIREFGQMADRVSRQISQRTDMLSGVSHDLRTPLTRMKLALEMSKDKDGLEGMRQDISDMENLIEEYLDFAKNQEREKMQKVDLKNFIESEIIWPYIKTKANLQYEIQIESEVLAYIKALSYKRAITNLIDNGLRYGQNVKILVRISRKKLIMSIEDDGPGIPEEKRRRVFEPFFRVDQSRNLNFSKSGSGLGMSIAMDAIASHGGKIRLLNSKLGGLKVIISIPI